MAGVILSVLWILAKIVGLRDKMDVQCLPFLKVRKEILVVRKFAPLGPLRRVTMHRALILASCAVLLSLFLTGPRLALADGDLQRVNHIIIVMQENHSFDNYFGVLAYAPNTPYHSAKGSGRRRACPADDHTCVDGLSCKPSTVPGDLVCKNRNPSPQGHGVRAFDDPRY